MVTPELQPLPNGLANRLSLANTCNKTDAGNGSKAICRVSHVLRPPPPDPRRYLKEMSALNRQEEVDTLLARLCAEGMSDDAALARLHREHGIGLMFLWKTLATARSMERRPAMKQVLMATRSSHADSPPNKLAIDAKHCPRCGEPLFRAMPGETSRDEAVAFLSTAKIFEGMPPEGAPWIHPGLYCPNGCFQPLWSLATNRDNKRMESND